MKWRLETWWLSAALLLGTIARSDAAEPDWTKKHEPGRCAIRGHCGKQSWLGAEIPCADNGLAATPDNDARDKLVALCGEEWADTDVCCSSAQIDDMMDNFGRVNAFIAGCPACKKNFYNLFCTFTCSPDQSLFVNVTETAPAKDNKFMSTAVDVLIADEYGIGFYDSCRDVKFGPTNSNAMKFIGGGAQNFTEFFKFLGKKEPPFHSPFQIDFPRAKEKRFPEMEFQKPTVRACNDSDVTYRCSCVDCPGSCTELPKVTEYEACKVGRLHCFSFAVILVYSIFIALLIIAISGHIAYQTHSKQKNERLRLIQDIEPNEDDEGDIFQNPSMLKKPTEQYPLNTIFDRIFYRLGLASAQFPGITIGFSILVVGLLSMGWLRFAVEKDPVKLWVAPNSAAAEEKQYFDEQFGPFFRAEQAFLVNDTQGSHGPVLSYETLAWWFDVESRIQRFKSEKEGVTLKDVCFNPTGTGCAVQSVTGYFQGDFSLVDQDKWSDHIVACSKNPVGGGDDVCLPPSQQPLDPHLIFGDYEESVLDSTALVVTWVVNNYNEESERAKTAADWEEGLQNALINAQREAKERGLRLSYNTEISLEQELNKSSNTDARIVIISYVIMFLYASLSLGSTTLNVRTILRSPSTAFVQSKFMLGIFGIVIVLMSVSASVGLFSAAGIKVTLIIAEVIPFLVLAVGVDNIFLIVHEFERVNVSSPEAPIPERVGRALGRMGPSILLSASAETAAFALGTAVGMPAVRNFAAYAAGAVFINALLQVTMFVAVLTLNQQRVEDKRVDCFPCFKLGRSNMTADGAMIFGADEEGSLQKFIRRSYAPTLLGKKFKIAIITIFLGLFTAGLTLIPYVELGLEQRDALPSDSYLIQYFDDLAEYLGVGPPVYFVSRDLNIADHSHQLEVCGRFGACDEFSLANILEGERKRPELSYIATPTANWVDDFFTWLNPVLDCCNENGERCFADRDPEWSPTLQGMPEGEEFVHYVNKWLQAPSDVDCPLGGKAAYSNAVVVDNETYSVPASHFRTSHTPLRTQKDFIDSYAAARRIAEDISESTSAQVFPYSKHYIFFDQYASIVHLSTALLGSALAIILLVSALLLGSIRTAIVVAITVAMTIVDIVGTMYLAGVSLNAVSLVNLIICVGISVEFCAHIARAFTFPSSTVMERVPRNRFKAKDVRAWTAMVNVGGSVFSGITITKLLGVCVLAFTRSKIFEIYYFRVWLALVIWAASHALVFLPVMLSIFGGRGYADPESEGGLEQDLRNRRYRPLLAADDYDSDD